MTAPNLDVLYQILLRTARRPTTMTYKEVSDAYSTETGGDWRGPRTWGHSLGQINAKLHRVGCPAISAVVVSATDGLPGYGFWDCCPSVPKKPSNPSDATRVWSTILDKVYATTAWPNRLPGNED
jgi:hypothetical protein